ncbi:MAG: ribosome silencing factor [Rhizobiaceae bacterium]|nr:ribosome silencing factor [Rhizobiaceae bacterium]
MQVTGVIGVSQPETVSSAQSQRKANKLNAQIQTTSAAPGERPESLLETILASLDESKAEETTHIDIVGKSPVADHMIVTSGRSHRHVNAVTDRLLRDLKDAGEGSPKVEGVPACDWVLVDTGDVIVHIFRPEVRDFYNLEKLWSTIAEGEMA